MTTADSDAAIKYAPTPEGLEEFAIPDAYADWLKAEGVKVIVDYAFDDIANVELGPWERKGGKGAVINIPYHVLTNDTHVVEIDPGGKSSPSTTSTRSTSTSSPGAARPASGRKARPRRRRSSGARAASSPFRSTAGTSTSTAAAPSPPATSP